VDAVEACPALWARRMHSHAIHAKVSRGQKLGFVAAVKAVFAKPLCQGSYSQLVAFQFNLLHHFFLDGFFLIACITLSRILFMLALGDVERQRMPSASGNVMSVTFSCSVML
jgi:hypothetical protein